MKPEMSTGEVDPRVGSRFLKEINFSAHNDPNKFELVHNYNVKLSTSCCVTILNFASFRQLVSFMRTRA